MTEEEAWSRYVYKFYGMGIKYKWDIGSKTGKILESISKDLQKIIDLDQSIMIKAVFATKDKPAQYTPEEQMRLDALYESNEYCYVCGKRYDE